MSNGMLSIPGFLPEQSGGYLPLTGGTLTGDLTMTGGLLVVRSNEDVVTTLGTVALGYDGTNADYATWAHRDNMTQLNMALSQGPAGNTTVNAKSGQSVGIGVAAVPSVTVSATTATFADAINMAFAAGTGTKIGTATTQKIGFFNAAPVVQGASVADAPAGGTGAAAGGWDTAANRDLAIAAINNVISRLEALGLIATV